jgi:pectate lyase
MLRRLAPALLLLLPVPAVASDPAPGQFLEQAEAAAARLAVPAACGRVQADADGRVRRHPLPARIAGAAAGTTGGLGHRLLLVDSAEDTRDARTGTLRWSVTTARREGGGWIAFAPAPADRTIRLGAGLRLPPNTTIDGGCGGIVLHAAARETTLLVTDATNVIISGLAFTKSGYAEPEDRIGDAIGLRDRFDRVAILNNVFTRCGDGCIDVVRGQLSAETARVTVAFNRIATHNKAMLVGTLACTAQRGPPACARPLEHLGDTLRPTIRLTLVGNVFLHTSQRHPKVVAGAFVHSVNNLIVLGTTRYSDGRESATYGAGTADGGMIASEGDILVNPTPRPRLGLGPVPARGEAADGVVASGGTVSVGAVRIVQHAPALAWAELAAEAAPPISLDALHDPVRVAGCLLRHAGPPGAASAWPRSCAESAASIDANLGQSSRASPAPSP